MNNTVNRLLSASIVALLLASAIPAASASTITITLNPATHVAKVDSVSSTTIILTYPANSSLSRALNGYNSSKSLNGTFTASSDSAQLIQGRFDHWDQYARIQNMSITFSRKADGNATAFVVRQSTDIAASVSGVFTIANGSVHANLGWRSFSVPGSMTVRFGDHQVEVNQVGSSMDDQLGDHPLVVGALLGLFGTAGLWHRGMVNFSSLNSPLSTWNKAYDSSTNTTTFSKTISGQASLKVQATINGQAYGLSVVSDPSASIATVGYASASSDTLTIGQAPAPQAPIVPEVAAVAVVALAGGILFGMRRSRAKASPASAAAPSPAVTS